MNIHSMNDPCYIDDPDLMIIHSMNDPDPGMV